jgi:HK97 family phage portal protein
MMAHLLLRGNAYSRIVPGPRGFADQLVPLHPDFVKPVRNKDGTVKYEYKLPNRDPETFLNDEIFHVRGMSLDGLNGLSPVSYARESIGLSLATEEYGSRLFRNGTNVGMILTHPGVLGPTGKQSLREDLEKFHTGLEHSHKTLLLSENIRVDKLGMTSEDAQFLETRRYQIAEIARIYRVPLVLLQETDKATSWGSGIEQFLIAFVVHTIRPWLVRWEQAISKDLILATGKYFAEFKLDGLLRGDSSARGDFYYKALGGGSPQTAWMTRNEVRNLENMNPVDGGDGFPTAEMAESDEPRDAE